MIKLIGTIFILNVTLAFGQGAPNGDINSRALNLFEPIDYKIIKDTLSLVSTSDFLYYPFGVFKNYEGLKKAYPKFYNEKREFYYLTDGDSYAKFFRDYDKEKLEIIYARINSSKIQLSNGIVTGMSKREVLSKFLKSLPDNLDNITVLKLESGLLGVWHYYKFDTDVLISFYFDTDYQTDKN